MGARVIQTLDELKFNQGKSYIFQISNAGLLTATEDNIVITTGDEPVTISSLDFEATEAPSLLWRPYFGTTFTGGTGTVITEIPRNQIPGIVSDIDVRVNPTGISLGTPFIASDIELVAQSAAGGRNYINEFLIERFFKLKAKTSYTIQIKNTSGVTAPYEFSFDVYRE